MLFGEGKFFGGLDLLLMTKYFGAKKWVAPMVMAEKKPDMQLDRQILTFDELFDQVRCPVRASFLVAQDD